MYPPTSWTTVVGMGGSAKYLSMLSMGAKPSEVASDFTHLDFYEKNLLDIKFEL
jgi:hypothetical protein